MNKPIVTAIIVGAGHRSLGYAEFAKANPDKLKIVGVADPQPDRRKFTREYFGFSEDMCFESAEELAARGKLADCIINGTMDAYHVPTSLPLLAAGYDILLEKPFATNMHDVEVLEQAAKQYGCKVMICHEMRYTPFYAAIKQQVLNGAVGRIVHVQTAEHVSYHHFSSCYVRGKWNNTAACGASVLLAKCCHDLDFMSWLMNDTVPVAVDSTGSLSFFTRENAPAKSGTHCMLDCPLENTCDYSVRRMHLEHPVYWGAYVWPELAYTPELNTHENRLKAIMQPDFPHSRCVWKCNNNQVDRQSVIIEFANGAVATHNMVTGSAAPMRKIHIIGTEGEIEGIFETNKFIIRRRKLDPAEAQCSYTEELVDVNTDASGDHGGGDDRLVADFVNFVGGRATSISCTELSDAVTGYKIVFAADTAMVSKQRVDFVSFCAEKEQRY